MPLAALIDNEPRYELIDGQKIVMSPAGTNHQSIQLNLSLILGNFLRKKRCKLFLEHKVVFDNGFWLQPDLLIVCDRDKIKRTQIDGAPDFIAEILSPATELRDIGIKKDTYEKYGVKEYWIIDPGKKSVTVYLLTDGRYKADNVYRVFSPEEWEELTAEEQAEQKLTLKLSLYDELTIDINDIFEDLCY